jgi:hypothetical protein
MSVSVMHLLASEYNSVGRLAIITWRRVEVTPSCVGTSRPAGVGQRFADNCAAGCTIASAKSERTCGLHTALCNLNGDAPASEAKLVTCCYCAPSLADGVFALASPKTAGGDSDSASDAVGQQTERCSSSVLKTATDQKYVTFPPWLRIGFLSP